MILYIPGSPRIYMTLPDIQVGTTWEAHGVEGSPAFQTYNVNDHDLFDGSWPDLHLTAKSSRAIDRGTATLPASLTTLLSHFGLSDTPCGTAYDIGRYEGCFTPTFSDVPYGYTSTLGGVTYFLHDHIQALYDAGYTAGCLTGPLRYCPDTTMLRADSSVFMLRGQFGSGYVPPAAPWNTFADDWSPGTWAEKWAEGMWNAGLTAGCLTNPLRFCPWDQFTRVQAAVFGLKMKYGTNYTPPTATGMVFADMTDINYYGTKWAEKAYADGLLPSCGISGGKPMFCPNDLVTRSWGAYLIVNAKSLPLNP
jgi:hypothetical protein